MMFRRVFYEKMKIIGGLLLWQEKRNWYIRYKRQREKEHYSAASCGSMTCILQKISRFYRTASLPLSNQMAKKRQEDISEIDQKIISIYSKGMNTTLFILLFNVIFVFLNNIPAFCNLFISCFGVNISSSYILMSHAFLN